MTEQLSNSEFEAVEKAVNEKLAKEATKSNEDMAKKIRDEVEKEFKQKAEIVKLQEELKANQEAIKTAQEEAVKARKEADDRAKTLEASFKKEIEDIVSKRQGIISGNNSPFENQTPVNTANLRNVNGKMIDVTKLDHKAIEEESRIALMKAWGIDPNLNPEWGRDPHQR